MYMAFVRISRLLSRLGLQRPAALLTVSIGALNVYAFLFNRDVKTSLRCQNFPVGFYDFNTRFLILNLFYKRNKPFLL